MNQQKFEVFLQPFSEKVSTDSWLEFKCTHCKKIVKAVPRVQKEMCFGGVGHRCMNCDAYYAFIACPSCKDIVGFDDKEWDQLSGKKGVNCPSCDALLYRNRENWRPTLGGYSAIYPNLNNWSSTQVESTYIANIIRCCTEDKKKAISIRHHSVGVRVNSSESALQYLETHTWYSPLVLSNSPNPTRKEEYKTPFDNDFHDNMFSFINNLRSALDMLSHEIAAIKESKYSESKIEFNKINTYLNDDCNELFEYITHFKECDLYTYLNQLRNVLQHRRVPILVTMADYETKNLDSIRAVNIRSRATIRLPDNPYDNSDEYIFNNNIEFFFYIRKVFNETKGFIIDVYSKITP